MKKLISILAVLFIAVVGFAIIADDTGPPGEMSSVISNANANEFQIVQPVVQAPDVVVVRIAPNAIMSAVDTQFNREIDITNRRMVVMTPRENQRERTVEGLYIFDGSRSLTFLANSYAIDRRRPSASLRV